MKKLIAVYAAAVVGAISAFAEEGGPKAGAPREKPPLVDLTLAGKIVKETKKDAKGNEIPVYVLVDDAGARINLPNPRAGAKGAEPVKLEEFVDQPVKLVGKGVEHTQGDRKLVRVLQIVRVEKAAAQAAPASDAEKKADE